MTPKILVPVGLVLALAACNQASAPDNIAATAGTPVAIETAPAAPASKPTSAEPVAANTPATDTAPPPLTPEAERGETGARNVLLTFARAIEQDDFDTAWEMLSPNDRKAWTRKQFAALFDGMNRLTVYILAGAGEGAAGSTFYTAPVTITGTGPGRVVGEAVLRRVNDVDGSSAADRRWHFHNLTLKRAKP